MEDGIDISDEILAESNGVELRISAHYPDVAQ
jgi:hypothetical protein